jgi:hypothetical protein
MSTYNPLEWQNGNSLSGYPLTQETDYPSFLVDAKFVQFDNFVPTLSTVFVDTAKIRLTIIFDYGTHTTIELLKDDYNKGEAYQNLRMYQPDTNRYLGILTFGDGPLDMWATSTGTVIQYNTPFLPETVRSVPKNDAVYTFDGSYGGVVLGRTSSDTTIFYNTAKTAELNSVTFNAVGGHSIAGLTAKGLRKINLVDPVANNINLVSNDVIKITPLNASSLTIGLAAGTAPSAFTLPTLTT